MNTKIKSFLVPIMAIAGLLLIIVWMAGAFDSKIEPGVITTNQVFKGKSLTLNPTHAQLYEDVPATVHSKQKTNVAARILAPIRAIHVNAGDSVKKGQLLIELDNRNNRSSVAQAKENINAIRAKLIQAKAHYNRTKNLFSKQSVTKATLEQASANYASLRAQLASARQQLESSQTTLSYSQIKAPFTARVIDRFAEPGDLASPGMKLLTLYDPQSLRIDANIRESIALTLTVGQTLETHIPALDKTVNAIIEEIVPAADPGARSFLIKAKLEHNEKILPGLFARIRIPSDEQQQLLIPEAYIKQMGQLDVVWVLENNTPIRRFIRTGQKTAEKIRVISGLSKGEKIVLPSQLVLQKQD